MTYYVNNTSMTSILGTAIIVTSNLIKVDKQESMNLMIYPFPFSVFINIYLFYFWVFDCLYAVDLGANKRTFLVNFLLEKNKFSYNK